MKHPVKRRLWAWVLCAALVCPALAAPPEEKPADKGSVTWEEVGERVRTGNLTARSLTENIRGIDSINYEAMRRDLREALNGLAEGQWAFSSKKVTVGEHTVDNPVYDPYQAGSMGQMYSTLRDTFDALKDGDTKKDNDAIRRQLENAVDQLAVGGETLFLNLVSLENTAADARRGLETLDRSLTELRLRQSLGQVPVQTVRQVEQTRAGVESQLATLESTIATYKAQLQLLMGEEPTGVLTLGPAPEVSPEELAALDPAVDLEKAKETSYTLFAAKRALDSAEKQWKDAKKDYSSISYQRTVAEHSWTAAQLTYDGAVKSFEHAFQSLARTVEDDRQAVESKAAAATYAESQAVIAQLKYFLGLISKNAMLGVGDELASARSELTAARLKLFMDYRSYRNAVDSGILN